VGTTANRGYRYPESTDNTRIWEHIENTANDVDADVTATWGATWTDYSSSFALTGQTTSPTKGNSTYSARYRRTGLHSIEYTGRLQIGSTFVAGSGALQLSVPVAATDSVAFGGCGSWWALDSTHAIYCGAVVFNDSSHLWMYRSGDTTAVTFATWTWSSGDELRWTIKYEI
jgi:hypothetical protein